MTEVKERRRDPVVDAVLNAAVPTPPDSSQRGRKRRSRRRTIAILVLIALPLTAIAMYLAFVGKSKVDPDFQLGLLKGESVSLDISDAAKSVGTASAKQLRRHIPISYSKDLFADSVGRGFLLSARVKSLQLRERKVIFRWTLRDAGRRNIGQETVIYPTNLTLPAGNESETVHAWIPRPSRAGKYQVNVSMATTTQQVLATRTESLLVLSDEGFTDYSTKSFVASVPKQWARRTDYRRRSGPKPRFVSEFRNQLGLTLVIDTTLGSKGDPMVSVAAVERMEKVRDGYTRTLVRRQTIGRHRTVQWWYSVGDEVTSEIYFFHRRNGYSVRIRGPRRYAEKIRALAPEVAASIKSQ